MNTNKKLSKAQKAIVDLLIDDRSLIVIKSKYYDFQEIIDSKRNSIIYFKRTTLEVLVRRGILIETLRSGRYRLNPDFRYRNPESEGLLRTPKYSTPTILRLPSGRMKY